MIGGTVVEKALLDLGASVNLGYGSDEQLRVGNDMTDSWSWAQSSSCYEQLTDNMGYSWLWAQSFKCYQQHWALVDLNDSVSWA